MSTCTRKLCSANSLAKEQSPAPQVQVCGYTVSLVRLQVTTPLYSAGKNPGKTTSFDAKISRKFARLDRSAEGPQRLSPVARATTYGLHIDTYHEDGRRGSGSDHEGRRDPPAATTTEDAGSLPADSGEHPERRADKGTFLEDHKLRLHRNGYEHDEALSEGTGALPQAAVRPGVSAVAQASGGAAGNQQRNDPQGDGTAGPASRSRGQHGAKPASPQVWEWNSDDERDLLNMQPERPLQAGDLS